MLFFITLFFNVAIDTCIASPQNIHFYYQHEGKQIHTLKRLSELHSELRFATNASMFQYDYKPCGLYVENGKVLQKAVVFNNHSVNAGLQPQGVFAITKQGKAIIVPLKEADTQNYKDAVQVSPLLVINGKINEQLPHSLSEMRRSGYGILKNGKVLFLSTEERVTFREFASLFIEAGCSDAVFIDGGVSETWKPNKNTYGEFGVLVGVSK